MNGPSVPRAHAGFTLFELIVVMTLVAILAAIGLPSFKYVTSSNRIAAEANQLLGDTRFARTEAIKEGQTVTVCASANPTATMPTCSGLATWQTGWIVFSDPNNARALPAGTLPLRAQAPLSVAFSSADTTAEANSFSAETFNREGFGAAYSGAAAIAATVSLAIHSTPSNTTWTRCLQVTPIGMVTVVTTATAGCT